MKQVALVRISKTGQYALEIHDYVTNVLELYTLDGQPIEDQFVWERIEEAGVLLYGDYKFPSLYHLKGELHENIMRHVRLAVAQLLADYSYEQHNLAVSSVLAPNWREFGTPYFEGNSRTALVAVKVGDQTAYYNDVESLIGDLIYYLESERDTHA